MGHSGIRILAAVAVLLLASTAKAEDLCPATEAKGAVTRIAYKDGQVVASGTWEVSGGATGALLEFRFDNDRLQAETRTGTSGTWSIVQRFSLCDRPLHALRVLVYPAVPGGEGRVSHCLDRFGRSDAAQFQFPCGTQLGIDHCVWECEEGDAPGCVGTCSGSASGGKLPYVLYLGVGGPPAEQKVGDSPEGTWNLQITCKKGEKLSFVARDNYGRGKPSVPAERLCGE
jgi:hypothetical protein